MKVIHVSDETHERIKRAKHYTAHTYGDFVEFLLDGKNLDAETPRDYAIAYSAKSKCFVGFCPDAPAVRFSHKDRKRVRELMEDGVNLYFKHHPEALQ